MRLSPLAPLVLSSAPEASETATTMPFQLGGVPLPALVLSPRHGGHDLETHDCDYESKAANHSHGRGSTNNNKQPELVLHVCGTDFHRSLGRHPKLHNRHMPKVFCPDDHYRLRPAPL